MSEQSFYLNGEKKTAPDSAILPNEQHQDKLTRRLVQEET